VETSAPTRRLSKEKRRRQLLEVASVLAREEGTDALTLAAVAERAGVTKPIAYDHFGTRAGLLVALHRDFVDRRTEAMRSALEAGGKTLDAVAEIVSAAYVDCVIAAGTEVGAIDAALSGSEEMETYRASLEQGHLDELRAAFRPFAPPAVDLDTVIVGVVGAANALSNAAAAGQMSRDDAVGALTRIFIGALSG
jgi:AcrR family transcriptional regulator